ADLDSIIAAINQGHVFQFLKKPWQPEDLMATIKEAAAEYDRLVQQAEENDRLVTELQSLHKRVTILEEEVTRLRNLK
ncbi:MAG TPA: hypothetical protein VGX76_22625, partial [Pirellulales bacterium]|nr:hypothetical protein [Pirellulales bacterium]